MAIEMYKAKNNLGPNILNNIFPLNNHIRTGLRSTSDFSRPRINTVDLGKDSLHYFGSVIWNIIHLKIKNSLSLINFKKKT